MRWNVCPKCGSEALTQVISSTIYGFPWVIECRHCQTEYKKDEIQQNKLTENFKNGKG